MADGANGDADIVRGVREDASTSDPHVIRWEYQTMIFGGNPIVTMNKAGDKGWEAVQLIGDTPNGPLWMMKRRKSLIQKVSSLSSLKL